MTKCSVASVRKRSVGSNRDAANSGAAHNRTATALASRNGARARHMSEEVEVGDRRQTDAGERALRDREIRLVPQADVRQIGRENTLRLGEGQLAAFGVERGGGFVEQGVDLAVAVVTAVEAGRRRLR